MYKSFLIIFQQMAGSVNVRHRIFFWIVGHCIACHQAIPRSRTQFSLTQKAYLLSWKGFDSLERLDQDIKRHLKFSLQLYKTQVVGCSNGHNSGSVGACSFDCPVSLLHEALHSSHKNCWSKTKGIMILVHQYKFSTTVAVLSNIRKPGLWVGLVLNFDNII
jgi:hypothetical protein